MKSTYLFIGLLLCVLGTAAILLWVPSEFIWWAYVAIGVAIVLIMAVVEKRADASQNGDEGYGSY